MERSNSMVSLGQTLRTLRKPDPERFRRALDWHLRSQPILQTKLRQASTVQDFVRTLLDEDNPGLGPILRFIDDLEDADDPGLQERQRRKEEVNRAWEITWEPEFQPPPPEHKTFEEFKTRRAASVQKARAAAERWSSREGQPILTLSGPPGTGKSHLAKAAYAAVVSRGGRAFFVSEGQLVEEFHSWVGLGKLDRLQRDLREVPWFILDDLGTQAMGEWAQGLFDHLITARHESAGATRFMVTTNLLAKDIQPRVASRIGDRLKATVVAIDAPDYRVRRS